MINTHLTLFIIQWKRSLKLSLSTWIWIQFEMLNVHPMGLKARYSSILNNIDWVKCEKLFTKWELKGFFTFKCLLKAMKSERYNWIIKFLLLNKSKFKIIEFENFNLHLISTLYLYIHFYRHFNLKAVLCWKMSNTKTIGIEL